MNTLQLNQGRRTIRKFTQVPISNELLNTMIDAARLCPSAANMQPLRYKIISDPQDREELFPHLHWAGYLQDGAPKASEQPTAYILICQDICCRAADASIDAGAAAMTISLVAQEAGIATCWIGSFDKEPLQKVYHLSQDLKVLLIIALGYPAQTSLAEPMIDSHKYWLDPDGILHVPKRSLNDILI